MTDSSSSFSRYIIIGLVAVILVGAGISVFLLTQDTTAATTVKVVKRWPHDRAAFTQGLLFHDGYFYESTGLNGQSTLRKVDPETGKVLQLQRLNSRYFAEGLALVNGVLIQLTWKAGAAFSYNSSSFQPLQTFNYQGEGWGLTYDGENLIMSNGSAQLTFRDPNTFRVIRELTVTDKQQPVKNLNELEYINGEIWANVWRTDDIVRIDPASGEVRQRLNLAGLVKAEERYGGEDVLNGIAYDAEQDRIFVTGKNYAYIYQIEF